MTVPEEDSLQPYHIEVLREVDQETARIITEVYQKSPEHEYGTKILQRSEPSSEEFEQALANPSICKCIVRGSQEEVLGIFLVGQLVDFQAMPGNFCCTQFYDQAAFFRDFFREWSKDTQRSQFRHMNVHVSSQFDITALEQSIAETPSLLYFVGNGWFRSEAQHMKKGAFRKVLHDTIPEHFSTGSVRPAVFVEISSGVEQGEQDVREIITLLEGNSYIKIGQQDYLVIDALPKVKRRIVPQIMQTLLRLQGGEQTASVPEIAFDPITNIPKDNQTFVVDAETSVTIRTDQAAKLALLDPLWEAYKKTFPSEETSTSIQIQSQDRESMTAVLKDASSTVFLINNPKGEITGFWITFSDIPGIAERNPELGGLHSLRTAGRRLQDQFNLGDRPLYTYTIGAVPLEGMRPSRTIAKALFPTLLAVLKKGASVLGDMSVTTKASSRIFKHLRGIPILNTHVQSQNWYILLTN